MREWPDRRLFDRLKAPFMTACLIGLWSPTIQSSPLSNQAFEQLGSDLQQQLDERYNMATSGDELFPGATLAIALSDGRVAAFATGLADVESGRPMSPGSRMPAGSIGKTFVAALVLRLAADGVLSLDDPVARWLGGESWFHRLANSESMTVRHLLNHSSGLIDHVFDEQSGFSAYLKTQWQGDVSTQVIEPRTLVRFAFDHPALFPAGEGFHYSDTGYLLLGMIIEKTVPGNDYYRELERRILVPLDLDQTSPMNRRSFAGLAAGYAPRSRSLFDCPYKVAENGSFVFDPSLEWAGGGLVTSSQDLVKWAIALFSGRIIEDAYLETMLTSVARPVVQRDAAGRVYGYGLGVSIAASDHGTVYRHGGFFPGYNALLAYYPDVGVAVAMQINADNTAIEGHFKSLVSTIMDRLAGAQP